MSGLDTALFEAPGDALPRPFPNCYWLVPGRLLAGEYPAPHDAAIAAARLASIVDAGVRQFVDLTEASEPLVQYASELPLIGDARRAALSHRRFAIVDMSVPTVEAMRDTLSAIDATLGANEIGYLHCRGGMGRTGTVAGCLMVHHGLTAERALALLDRKWRVMAKSAPGLESPETVAQREFVTRWGRARR